MYVIYYCAPTRILITRFTDLSVGVPSAGTPFGVHPRPRAEGEAQRREGPQSSTQQPARPKEEDEDFNSSLSLIFLARTTFKVNN